VSIDSSIGGHASGRGNLADLSAGAAGSSTALLHFRSRSEGVVLRNQVSCLTVGADVAADQPKTDADL
jgi:hypothetical protein